MRAPFARPRLALLGGALVVAGAVMLWSAVGAVGIAWDLPSWTPPPSHGPQVYQAYCAACHGGPTGGEIDDYPPKHNANGHTWQHADCELLEVIRTGRSLPAESARRPPQAPAGLSMPAFRERLSDTEIGDVLAFIRTMWTDDERAAQERLTRERC